MAARLKVFVTSDGLTDFIVAATSRPKALAAWGVHQDLFKSGEAHETDDAALVKAASAQPGEVLRRPTGAKAPPKPAPRRPPPKGPTQAQKDRLAKARATLEALRDEHDTALAEIAAQRNALAAREAKLVEQFERQEAKARAVLEKAREAMERAST